MSPRATEQPSSNSDWRLLTRARSAGYQGPSGKTDPRLLEKAEKRKGYKAVYIIGLSYRDSGKPNNDIRIGTATNPPEIFKTAQQFNPDNVVVHAVCWTPGHIWADSLKKRLEKELSPFMIRGSWYDLDPQMVVGTLVACAHEMKVDLFNDHERYVRYEKDIADSIKRRPLLANAAMPSIVTPIRDNVTIFNPRRR